MTSAKTRLHSTREDLERLIKAKPVRCGSNACFHDLSTLCATSACSAARRFPFECRTDQQNPWMSNSLSGLLRISYRPHKPQRRRARRGRAESWEVCAEALLVNGLNRRAHFAVAYVHQTGRANFSCTQSKRNDSTNVRYALACRRVALLST